VVDFLLGAIAVEAQAVVGVRRLDRHDPPR
jgi:hypothetical protein